MKKELKTELERIAYNCRKATFLIEKKQSEPLSLREQFELRTHLAGCYICRVYEQQSQLISRMLRHLLKTEVTDIQLDDQYKDQLRKKIAEKTRENR